MRSLSILPTLLFLVASVIAQDPVRAKNELFQYEGTYEFPDGRRITLGIFDEFKKSLVYLDLQTLRQGALIPVSGDVFKENNDPLYSFEFGRDSSGRIASLTTTQKDATVKALRVMPHERTAITFNSANRRLSGDLYMPASPGRHPIVVFAHGSGPATRSVSFLPPSFSSWGLAS